MSELTPEPQSSSTPVPALFATRAPEPQGRPLMPFAIAGLVVALVVAAVLLATHRKPKTGGGLQPLDSYATSLPVSDIVMSESTSLSGGKSTFVDGRIRNTGTRTVSGITVQVLFANDEQLPAQMETLPLMLIRTHEPYVDTQPVGVAPLKQGDEREFRLIFENIASNWNQTLPQIHVITVE